MTKHSGYLRLFTTKISLYKIYNLWIWAAAFKLPSFFCLVAGGRFPTWFVERIRQRGLTTGLRLRRANAVRPYGMASLLLRFDLDFVCYEIIGFRRVVKLVRIKKRATKGRPYDVYIQKNTLCGMQNVFGGVGSEIRTHGLQCHKLTR